MDSADYFDFGAFKNDVLSLMPKSPINYIVDEYSQQNELNSLKETIGGRRFFFVTNLERFEIEHSCCIERWLGYSEKDFTNKKYLDFVMHPGRRKSIIMVARELYNRLCAGKYTLNFMVQRYASLVALKHYNGHYLLANKISSVFQYDNKNRLTAHLNEFTIIGNYTGQPMEPTFFTSMGDSENRGKEILENTMERFLKLNFFSPRELQIARKLAYEPGIKEAQIGNALNISSHTVDEYGKRFPGKARVFFQQPFSKVSEAAIYLKKEGLL